MKRRNKNIVVIIGILCILILLSYIIPAPIDGKWRTNAINCLCPSYNFLLFKSGIIYEYSELHIPHKKIFGRYKIIGGNKYTIYNNSEKIGTFNTGWIYGRIVLDGDTPDICWRPILSSKPQEIIKKAEQN